MTIPDPSIEPSTARRLTPADYRTAMRNLTGAVTVLATGPLGARCGLTATAVCSLSDDPPTLVVCVNRSASAHDELLANRRFSVNVLSAEQSDIAARFSGRTAHRGEDRFADHPWSSLATGAPALTSALLVLDCEIEESRTVATHTLLIARVLGARARDDADPLLYLRGRFWTLATPD